MSKLDMKSGTLHQADVAGSDTGEATPQTNVSHDIYTVRFSPDGTQLVTSSHDGTAVVWNVVTGKPVQIFRPTDPTLNVVSATFSPNGKTCCNIRY